MSVNADALNKTPEDKPVFQTTLNGTFIALWARLRQMAAYRLSGSPYYQPLQALDALTADYYFRFRNALPGDLQNQVSASAPMLNVGSDETLRLPAKDAPVLLGVPPGIVQEMNGDTPGPSVLALPRLVGQAIFEFIPYLLDELKQKISMNFAENPPADPASRKKMLIQKRLLPTLQAIAADLAGTALGKFPFANSAAQQFVNVIPLIDITEDDKPLTILRPWVNYELLRLFHDDPSFPEPDKDSFRNELDQLQTMLNQIDSGLMDIRYRTTIDLAYITLQEMKDALIDLTDLLLKTPLDTLKGYSLYQMLVVTWSSQPGQPGEMPQWGTDTLGSGDMFVEIPSPVALTSFLEFDPNWIWCVICPCCCGQCGQ